MASLLGLPAKIRRLLAEIEGELLGTRVLRLPPVWRLLSPAWRPTAWGLTFSRHHPAPRVRP